MKVTFEVEEEGFDDNVDETKEKDLVAQFLQFIQVRCMTFQGLIFHHSRKYRQFQVLYSFSEVIVCGTVCVFFLKEANISMDKFIHILLNNLMKISQSTVFFTIKDSITFIL